MKGEPASYGFSAYRFTEPCNNLMFVNFTPKSTYSSVAVSVEVLYGTSTIADVAPPGIVYQNINLWVGLAGFATERNMEVATVIFRVDRSWIDENDIALPTIQLFSYDRLDEKWIPLPTVVSDMDSSYTYFKSETMRFGNLAIVSSSTKAARRYGIVPPLIKKSDTESPAEEPDTTPTTTPSQTQSPTPTPTRKSSIPGLPAPGIMATMAMIGAAAWLMKRGPDGGGSLLPDHTP
jgi:PGF-pre-PGF domain-containing protein